MAKKKIIEEISDNGLIDSILAQAPKENLHFIDRAMEITEQIFQILESKGYNQKNFAEILGKSEAEVSKWLSGYHNFTLRSLTLIESKLEKNIFSTSIGERYDAAKDGMVVYKVYSTLNNTKSQEQIGQDKWYQIASNTELIENRNNGINKAS